MTDSLRFCSKPEYIQLLDSVGTDVVELSGNHEIDWGPDIFLFTLGIYKEHHIQVFAGGENLESARKALTLEDHGNKIAFIGCNPVGPVTDWATEDRPGSAPCDFDWEVGEITRLREQGYLVIVTFQDTEAYVHVPGPWQQRDFRKVAEAGATIVSGSQAHFPQSFEFAKEGLIHYGLGNLFFDQMNPLIDGTYYPGTRREFIDRHVFYDGRYVGTDLVTAMLEDYARPRLMTAEERLSLLGDIFQASGW
jgi:poly-gamma-glutamate synthesis protein (capsule biosynthesis protein)